MALNFLLAFEKVLCKLQLFLQEKFIVSYVGKETFNDYHRGLSTLTKYHREAAGLQIFFHHSDTLSGITF